VTSPAEETLRELGVTDPKDIDIEAIAWCLGARVKYRPLDRCEARITGNGDQATARTIAASHRTSAKGSEMVEVIDRDAVARPAAAQGVRIWRAALAALSANLVGIRLARFAYTPLIPALAAAGWFTANAATYLGAANLAGYLVGALLGRRMLAIAHPPVLLRVMLLSVAASFFACELSSLGFAWFFLWRFISGYAGGAIMVLAAPTVLAATPMERRGTVGGFIFTGVGIGVALSGTLIPFMLRIGGLEAAWAGLGVMTLLLIFEPERLAGDDAAAHHRRGPSR
jgi:hypothetical protein